MTVRSVSVRPTAVIQRWWHSISHNLSFPSRKSAPNQSDDGICLHRTLLELSISSSGWLTKPSLKSLQFSTTMWLIKIKHSRAIREPYFDNELRYWAWCKIWRNSLHLTCCEYVYFVWDCFYIVPVNVRVCVIDLCIDLLTQLLFHLPLIICFRT